MFASPCETGRKMNKKKKKKKELCLFVGGVGYGNTVPTGQLDIQVLRAGTLNRAILYEGLPAGQGKTQGLKQSLKKQCRALFSSNSFPIGLFFLFFFSFLPFASYNSSYSTCFLK